MKGSNQLTLCQVVVMQALQEYFDRMTKKPEFKITNVRADPQKNSFIVDVAEIEEEDEK